MRVNRFPRRDDGEAGFTLTELLIAMALISITAGIVAFQFTKSWELWRRNWTDVRVQRRARVTLEKIAYELRHARPSSVKISALAGEPRFSRIQFRHINSYEWEYYKKGFRLYSITTSTTPAVYFSTTNFVTDGVESIQFMFVDLRDLGVLDVGVTISETAYRDRVVRQQLTQRVRLRNP